ncbi:8766_t:CDS:2, partial [Racocetra fulgida]
MKKRITSQRQTNIEEDFRDNNDNDDGDLRLPASFLETIGTNGQHPSVKRPVNEFKDYIEGRYLSAHGDFIEQKQPEIPTKIMRRRTTDKITRLVLIPPEVSEFFYLRCILMHHPFRTWKDLKTVNRTIFSSYQETAHEMGLFAIDNEGVFIMKKAVENFYTPLKLRFLFVQLILDSTPALELWEKFNQQLSSDIKEQSHHNQQLSINITLQQIAYMLTEHGRR